MITYKEVEQVANFESPLSPEMENALNEWALMYQGKAEWLAQDGVFSLGLPAFIAAEIARQVVLEVKWNITAKVSDGAEPPEDGSDPENDRSRYLKAEFKKCMEKSLREKLEVGAAAGSMVIKPYPRDGHFFFEYVAAWSMYPIAFDGAGELTDVIFRDTYTSGKTTYTRLERHKLEVRKRRDIDKNDPDGEKTETVAVITQRCFKSQLRENIGTECSLKEVPIWADLQPEAILRNTGGKLLIGWYKVASANNVDLDSPLGVSVFAKAKDLIRDADKQYSRLLWEFEGGELAVDVDPTVLRPKNTSASSDGSRHYDPPQLNQRLFRGVDLNADETYHVFSPPLRDGSLLNGLNQILSRVEDCCGLARGTVSIPTQEAMTATQMKILRKRTYDTIAGNQQALETALRDVVHAMDVHATLAGLAPEGEYELSFEWDDSIITDTDQQLNERLALANLGVLSRAELRSWYLGETDAQANAAIAQIDEEQMQRMMQQSMIEGSLGGGMMGPPEGAGEPLSGLPEQ